MNTFGRIPYRLTPKRQFSVFVLVIYINTRLFSTACHRMRLHMSLTSVVVVNSRLYKTRLQTLPFVTAFPRRVTETSAMNTSIIRVTVRADRPIMGHRTYLTVLSITPHFIQPNILCLPLIYKMRGCQLARVTLARGVLAGLPSKALLDLSPLD